MTADAPDTANLTEEDRAFPIPLERARVTVPALMAERLGSLTQKDDGQFAVAMTSDDGSPRLVTVKLAGDDAETRIFVRVETLAAPRPTRDPMKVPLLVAVQLLLTVAACEFGGRFITLGMLGFAAVIGVVVYIEGRNTRERTERDARERRRLIYKVFGAVERVSNDPAQASGYRVGTIELGSASGGHHVRIDSSEHVGRGLVADDGYENASGDPHPERHASLR